MKNKVREMIKNVIEENAVSFKETTSQVLLTKVGNSLSEKYVEISQKLFEDMDLPGHGGGFTENPDRHGGGLLPPINRVNTRDTPLSAEDSQRQTNNQYDQNDPFWSSQRGQLWLQNFRMLQDAMRNPTNPSRSMRDFLQQNNFQNVEAFRQYLMNQGSTYAQQYGVVLPPLAL